MNGPRCSDKVIAGAGLVLECELVKGHEGPHRENCRLSWLPRPAGARVGGALDPVLVVVAGGDELKPDAAPADGAP